MEKGRNIRYRDTDLTKSALRINSHGSRSFRSAIDFVYEPRVLSPFFSSEKQRTFS